MTEPWTLLLAILGTSLVYVLAPIVAGVFAGYRRPRVTRCPETGEAVVMRIDARHAAATSIPGPPELRVAACSRWPEREECDQACIAPSASA